MQPHVSFPKNAIAISYYGNVKLGRWIYICQILYVLFFILYLSATGNISMYVLIERGVPKQQLYTTKIWNPLAVRAVSLWEYPVKSQRAKSRMPTLLANAVKDMFIIT